MNLTKCIECLNDIDEHTALNVFGLSPLCMLCYGKLYNEYIQSIPGESQ